MLFNTDERLIKRIVVLRYVHRAGRGADVEGIERPFCVTERSRPYKRTGLRATIPRGIVSVATRARRIGSRLASPGLFLAGWAVLVPGILFYLIVRPEGIAYISEKIRLDLFAEPCYLTAPVWGSFPEFIHPMAFSLIGIGLLSHKRWSRLFVCSSILLLNLFFEIGQKYKDAALEIVPRWFDGIPMIENVDSYFRRGTFDLQDVLAICLGSTIAFVVSELAAKDLGRRGR
jgi:hypothetical protein